MLVDRWPWGQTQLSGNQEEEGSVKNEGMADLSNYQRRLNYSANPLLSSYYSCCEYYEYYGYSYG